MSIIVNKKLKKEYEEFIKDIYEELNKKFTIKTIKNHKPFWLFCGYGKEDEFYDKWWKEKDNNLMDDYLENSRYN